VEPHEAILTPAGSDRVVEITDYHWTRQDDVSALANGGGSVFALRELPTEWRRDGGPAGLPA
jgi:hypothetical protein